VSKAKPVVPVNQEVVAGRLQPLDSSLLQVRVSGKAVTNLHKVKSRSSPDGGENVNNCRRLRGSLSAGAFE